MASLFAVLVAIAAIWLLFALDPGGAIAESGFPDFRDMDWKQRTAWAFRLVGIGVALLLTLFLLIKDRAWRGPKLSDSWEPADPDAALLPAAVVSVLEERKVSARTLLAAIVEMCQYGTLQFEAAKTRSSYRYRLTQLGPVQFDWERLICDNLPSSAATVKALRDSLKRHEDAIGDQLGEYLQRQGLFHDNPMRVMREHFADGAGWAILAGMLMGIGGGLWLALWLSQWWANAIVGAVIGCTYWVIATPANTGMLPPLAAGAYELSQWHGLRESLSELDPADDRDEVDSMLAYAVALNAAQPWLAVALPAPLWLRSGEASSMQASDLDLAFHGFLSASEWSLAGRSE